MPDPARLPSFCHPFLERTDEVQVDEDPVARQEDFAVAVLGVLQEWVHGLGGLHHLLGVRRGL